MGSQYGHMGPPRNIKGRLSQRAWARGMQRFSSKSADEELGEPWKDVLYFIARPGPYLDGLSFRVNLHPYVTLR